MSRLSQVSISNLADSLLAKKKEAVAQAHAEYINAVHTAYLESVPVEILNFYKKFPKNIRICTTLRVIGNGFNHERVDLSDGLVAFKDDNSYEVIFQPSDKVASRLKKLHNDYKSAKENFNALSNETRGTLEALGTAKKVASAFPELEPMLNLPKLEVAVDLEGLRKRLA